MRAGKDLLDAYKAFIGNIPATVELAIFPRNSLATVFFIVIKSIEIVIIFVMPRRSDHVPTVIFGRLGSWNKVEQVKLFGQVLDFDSILGLSELDGRA